MSARGVRSLRLSPHGFPEPSRESHSEHRGHLLDSRLTPAPPFDPAPRELTFWQGPFGYLTHGRGGVALRAKKGVEMEKHITPKLPSL